MSDSELESLFSEPSFVDGEVNVVARRHLRGLIEALLFVSERPQKAGDLAAIARAETREVRQVLEEIADNLRQDSRGFLLEELAGGWQLRTNPTFAPFVRELTQAKPVKLSRAQIETLAIIAYRQPMTRPEIEDIRGVDVGSALKTLLERDLIRVLGKKEEPGRPLLYGTTSSFLSFFGLKSLRELPTLREFTELSDDSREVYEREIGEVLPEGPKEPVPSEAFDGGETQSDPAEATVEDANASPVDHPETLTPPTLRDESELEQTAEDPPTQAQRETGDDSALDQTAVDLADDRVELTEDAGLEPDQTLDGEGEIARELSDPSASPVSDTMIPAAGADSDESALVDAAEEESAEASHTLEEESTEATHSPEEDLDPSS